MQPTKTEEFWRKLLDAGEDGNNREDEFFDLCAEYVTASNICRETAAISLWIIVATVLEGWVFFSVASFGSAGALNGIFLARIVAVPLSLVSASNHVPGEGVRK